MTTLTDLLLKRSDFDYALPPEQIAQSPITPRDRSRLMVLDRKGSAPHHKHFKDIGDFLRAGDVMVINATRVFPARLRGRKPTGGKIELLLLRPDSASRWQALVRGTASAGTEFVFEDGLTAHLESELENGEWTVQFSRENVREHLERFGEMPLPPYIKRPEKNAADTETYQTVFAREEGSIAAPTAGFHFTPDLLNALRARGIIIAEITLHVGWGTFRPVRADLIQDHAMLPEQYQVSAETVAVLNTARQEKRRVIAIGTTAVRTLESIYNAERQEFQPGSGSTNLFIYSGYKFKAVDALITNFHLSHSTPLLLACAFYSDKEAFSLRSAYEEAIREGYRFYSYGDAMFIQ